MNITGKGVYSLGSRYYWGISSDTIVTQCLVGGNKWVDYKLPDNEEVLFITGDGSNNWGVTTQNGRIFLKRTNSNNWSDISLPYNKAVSIAGDCRTESMLAVINETGDFYETLGANWVKYSLPNNERALFVSGSGSPSGYWGVVTENGKVFIKKVGTGYWEEIIVPNEEEAVSITGNGGCSDTWGILTDKGRVYESISNQGWVDTGFPVEGVIDITGSGSPSGYWGVVTENGKVYESIVGSLEWSGGSLPGMEQPFLIGGSGYKESFWGIVSDSGSFFQVPVGL